MKDVNSNSFQSNNALIIAVISIVAILGIAIYITDFFAQNEEQLIQEPIVKEIEVKDTIELEVESERAVLWQLPQSLQGKFVFRLALPSDSKYRIVADSVTVSEEQLMTSYRYPISIVNGNPLFQEKDIIVKMDVHLRHTSNGDVTYFISAQKTTSTEIRGIEELSQELNLTWQVHETIDHMRNNDETVDMYYIHYDQVINNAASKWRVIDNVASASVFTNSQVRVELPKAAVYTERVRIGLVDIFSTLPHHVFVEHYERSPINWLILEDGKRVWNAPLPIYAEGDENFHTEHWGMVSSDILVTEIASIGEAEVQDSNLPSSLIDIRVADLDRFRKFRWDGIYYEVPSSYEPYQPRSFWRVPAEHIGQRFIRSIHEQLEERGSEYAISSYLETMMVLSMYHNIAQQNEGGFWITSPRSNWLFKDYGIDAGFYDTRFSTDAAVFLLEMYQQYGTEKALEAVNRYLDFLLAYAVEYSFETENSGLLVQDYFHPTTSHEPTHVSLNHLVAEMEFLLLYHLATLENEFTVAEERRAQILDIASRIRQAVHDTNMDWVKENNDLWYAYLPNGKYGLMDYPHLTRNDLRRCVKIIEEVWGEDDRIFRQLIHYKELYLKENNLPLW
ncbi:hypothetical protein BHU72_00110 [Desulfuribacillus stibiiarsenatis]|uniref:D-glucuronyl C5-epimerase C-terminal domain-containing protein n=1 Tax=Desulfuribacillus stibiiarsenatis TaxID=1390249 RepID=A0A1E5L982_9FIRM|nr:hypothetical protein [Desulfuribacillus stibiiarsenatis]OEH86717.1 hypothetical protein BHU72_00110 [Desulfuribacillus stibiiarsenatis]